MAEEKKDDKTKWAELLAQALLSRNDDKSSPDIMQMLLLQAMEKGEDSDLTKLLPFLMLIQQKPSSMENMLQMMMTMKMMENIMRPPEDETMKLLKYQAIMQMAGGKKSDLEDTIKLIALLNPQNGKEIKEMFENFMKEQQHQNQIKEIHEQHKKEMEEARKYNEQNLNELRNTIIRLYQDISSGTKANSVEEEMKRQIEFQNAIREYAKAMGWIQEMHLPKNKEEWSPDDYLMVINRIGETAASILGSFATASATKKTRKEVREMPETPPPQPAQQQNNNVKLANEYQEEQPQIEQNEPQEITDPELKDYVESMQVTEDGFLDKYGNFYKSEKKLSQSDLKMFKDWAKQNPDEARQMMEESKKAYEDEMRRQQELAKQQQEKAEENTKQEESESGQGENNDQKID